MRAHALTSHREPDLSYVETTTRAIAGHLRPGQLIVLESTTYPGTTNGVMKPILEAQACAAGATFSWPIAPSAKIPAIRTYDTAAIPKVVGGDGADALRRSANALYRRVRQDRAGFQPRHRRGGEADRKTSSAPSTSPSSTS